MEKNIIDKVKEELGVHGDYSGIELLRKLTQKRAKSHPDKYQDIEQKKIQNEKLKYLNGLFEELKKYLDEQQKNLPAVTKESDTNQIYSDLLNAIGDISDLQDQIELLTSENRYKDYKIEELNTQINELKDKKYEDEKNNIISSLNEIYKPSTTGQIVSGFSLLILITSQLKTVKDSLLNILENQEMVMTIIFFVFLMSVFYVVYKIILKHCIKYYQCKLINPSQLQTLRYFASGDDNIYFTEEDVERYIKRNMHLQAKLLFIFNEEIIYRELSNYIIVCLYQKKLIKSMKPDGLIHMFEINNNFSKHHKDIHF